MCYALYDDQSRVKMLRQNTLRKRENIQTPGQYVSLKHASTIICAGEHHTIINQYLLFLMRIVFNHYFHLFRMVYTLKNSRY